MYCDVCSIFDLQKEQINMSKENDSSIDFNFIRKSLNKPITYYIQLSDNFDSLGEALGVQDIHTCKIASIPFEIFDDYLKLVSEQIGDQHNLLHKYLYDNEFGGITFSVITMSNGFTKDVYQIKDVDSLAKAIYELSIIQDIDEIKIK